MNKNNQFQRGVTLIFAMIVLLILTLGGVAVMRSMNTALVSSANLAFRRDLINQAEQAVAKAIASNFPKGSAATGADAISVNYSPVALVTNEQSIPIALLEDDEFAKVGAVSNDLEGATSDVKIRYVIERLCNRATALANSDDCVVFEQPPVGGSSHLSANAKPEVQPVYRVSVRVVGPRNVKVFIQNTFTKPEV